MQLDAVQLDEMQLDAVQGLTCNYPVPHANVGGNGTKTQPSLLIWASRNYITYYVLCCHMHFGSKRLTSHQHMHHYSVDQACVVLFSQAAV